KDSAMELGGVLAALGAKVVQVCAAEGTFHLVDVEVDVVLPSLVERAEDVTADGASLGAARSLIFPDFCQQGIQGFASVRCYPGVRPRQRLGYALVKLFQPAMFEQADVIGVDA